MNILFIYSRKVEINDSGGARTMIQLIDFLSHKKDVHVFCLFEIEGINLPEVVFIKEEGDFQNQLHKAICTNHIDILMVPEAVLLGSIASKAVKGTLCKTVTALHNMPGYESIGLHRLLIESMLYNDSSIKKIRAFLLLVFFPLFKLLYVKEQKMAFRNAYNNCDILVLLSEQFFPSFIKEYTIRDGGKKLRAIGNGLSFDIFASEQDISNKKKQLLVVSRFDERQKRISKAIKLWAKLYKDFPDWRLVIVGFGRSEPLYRYLVKKYDVKNIEFVGKQSPLKYYMNASIFLMTSDFEGWGMTITEAQQCGCVPIALDTYASLRELINDGQNGYIVSDIYEMCDRVASLMENVQRRRGMAKSCVETSQRFLPGEIYEKYYQLFKELEER